MTDFQLKARIKRAQTEAAFAYLVAALKVGPNKPGVIQYQQRAALWSSHARTMLEELIYGKQRT